MKRVLVCAFAAAALTGGWPGAPLRGAAAESQTWNPGQGDTIDESAEPQVLATRPRTDRVWVDLDPATVTAAVNSNKIYLNNCKPNGCVVRGGQPASSIDGPNYQGSWSI